MKAREGGRGRKGESIEVKDGVEGGEGEGVEEGGHGKEREKKRTEGEGERGEGECIRINKKCRTLNCLALSVLAV
jgi:hypothetical protein